MRLYKLIYESLVRLLIKERISVHPLSEELQGKLNLIRVQDPPKKKQREEVYEAIIEDKEVKALVEESLKEVLQSSSEMARFWASFLEMVEILFMHYHSIRVQDWKGYLLSLRLMQPWMAVYDSLHYTRYMTIFWSMMNNLDEETTGYMENGLFSASLRGRRYSAIPHDQWIEVTMNKGSKMKGGWIGITQNESALNVHTKIVNKIAMVRETLHKAADLQARTYDHAENSKSRITKDEKVVQDITTCIDEWNCNPWNTEAPKLRSLESGLIASPELIADFESANLDDEQQITEIYNTRILSTKNLIHDKISLNKRANFAKAPNKKDGSVVARRADAMENKAMINLINIAQETASDLVQIMQYRVTDVCLPIFNINGTMRKAVKAKLC